MSASGARLLSFVRTVLPVLVCALAAHAAAYGTFTPGDPAHGYLGVYEAVVGGLSALAVFVVALATGALLTGRGHRLRHLVERPTDDISHGYRIASLALATTLVLIVQEGAEAFIPSDPLANAAQGAGAWLRALVTIVAAASVLVLLGRTCGRVVRNLLEERTSRPRASVDDIAAPRTSEPPRRRNALADFRALRAPPRLVC